MQLRGRQRHPNGNSRSFNYFFPQAALGRTTKSFQASELVECGPPLCMAGPRPKVCREDK